MERFCAILTALLFAFLVSASGFAKANSCEDKFQEAVKAGIFIAAEATPDGFLMQVDPGVWTRLDYNTKLGMAHNISCTIAGEGNTLKFIKFIDQQGHTLGTWDGISDNLEVVR